MNEELCVNINGYKFLRWLVTNTDGLNYRNMVLRKRTMNTD